jgi:histidine phosphotransferase ChpT
MKTDNSATLVALVGSRLCHDLISPIGAIQNGLELMTMAGAQASPELDLIRDSCDSAAARIRFFRIAFGTAGNDQHVSAREIASTLKGLTANSRIDAQWRLPDDQPRPLVQMAFLACLCCENALPLGGTIHCDKDGTRLSISATAPRVRALPECWDILRGAGDVESMTPDRVQFGLLALLAAERGMPLTISTGEAGVRIEIG